MKIQLVNFPQASQFVGCQAASSRFVVRVGPRRDPQGLSKLCLCYPEANPERGKSESDGLIAPKVWFRMAMRCSEHQTSISFRAFLWKQAAQLHQEAQTGE